MNKATWRSATEVRLDHVKLPYLERKVERSFNMMEHNWKLDTGICSSYLKNYLIKKTDFWYKMRHFQGAVGNMNAFLGQKGITIVSTPFYTKTMINALKESLQKSGEIDSRLSNQAKKKKINEMLGINTTLKHKEIDQSYRFKGKITLDDAGK